MHLQKSLELNYSGTKRIETTNTVVSIKKLHVGNISMLVEQITGNGSGSLNASNITDGTISRCKIALSTITSDITGNAKVLILLI